MQTVVEVLISLSFVISIGFIGGYIFNKIKVPGLVGMILMGILISPYLFNAISPNLLNISSYLRQIALIIILTRSGLNLDFKSLKQIGRPAILMCFIPATFEIIGTMLASHFLLDLSWFEGILLGAALGAVSPAVTSPRMIKLIDEGYGEAHQVPKLILAGSSVDDIYVIVIFYAFLGLVKNNTFNGLSIAFVPLTILSGIVIGLLVGYCLALLIKKTKWKLWINIFLMLLLSFLLVYLENIIKPYFDFSSLLAIMVIGMMVLFLNPIKAKNISNGYNKLWKVFEIILFTLVGASVNLSYAFNNFLPSLMVLIIALLFRMLGVYLCLIKTKLDHKEKLFCIFAYLPKATVQASIGGIALSMGLDCGSIILTVCVLSILISAPLGAMLIDTTYKKLLSNPKKELNSIT